MEAGPKKVKIKRISPLWSRTHRDANEPKNATTTTTSLSQKSFLIKKFRWWWWGGVFKKEEKKSERKTCSFSLLLFLWGKKLFLSPLAAKAS
jgi:hypothetical protein